MPNSTWQRAKQVFQEALDRTGEERARFVAEACADDNALRAEVEKLLAAHDEAGGFLDRPTADTGAVVAGRPEEGPGTRIGPYKLLQQIGEGGFGVVYMAEQETPIRRRVALKIIKPGMDTRQVIARFESERQALALMDHPNIAKVLDAGATESGRPYFVMELVKGVPLTEYCDANHLSTRDRLELFVQVCQAVHHAHEKGIIHRDIKPSNVMVTLHDGTPVPKIIDFGVAKATSQRLTEKTLFTAYGVSIGTPTYMSPEQAEMSGLEIDRRSDVYSLGVLLYELLTGTTPLDAEAVRTAAYVELLRLIREEEPPTPSARLSTLGEHLTEIARNRHVEPHALTKLVRGDLDWIVMKALDKDRRRRYESASDLARDLGLYFSDQPVTALPPSHWYRGRKFARRHGTSLAAAATIVAAVLLGGALARFGGGDVAGAAGPGLEAASDDGPVRRLLIDHHLDGAAWHDWRLWMASSYTRDGRHVLGYSGERNLFELLDMESDEVQPLARQEPDPRAWAFDVRLSPQRQRIASVFAVLRERATARMPRPNQVERWELRLHAVGGDQALRVSSWDGGDVERIRLIDWAPEEDRIWLAVGRPGPTTELAWVDVPDGSVHVLKTLGVSTTGTPRASLSPDGKVLAYGDDEGVSLLATDGTRDVRLERPPSASRPGARPVVDRNPVFAPDGSGVVFSSDRRGIQDLWFQPVTQGRADGEPRVVWADHGPLGIIERFAENGSLYYFFATTGWGVFTADLDTRLARASEPEAVEQRGGEPNTGAAYSSDGRFFAHLRGRGRRLVIVELATGIEREFPVSSAMLVGAVDWCPDGRSVVVTNRTEAAIHVDLRSGAVRPLAIPDPFVALCVDGGDIVYQRGAWGSDAAIVRRSTRTGEESILHQGSLGALTTSLDGTALAFVEVGDAAARLLVMPSSGGKARVLATSPARRPGIGAPQVEFLGITWYADGNRVLVVRAPIAEAGRLGQDTEWTLHSLPIDGTAGREVGTVHVLAGAYPPLNFSLHPDGTRFAFERNTGIIEQHWEIAHLLPFIQSGATHEAPLAVQP